MATEATLVEIIDGGRLLLKRATRGISKDKWNGPGGKIDEGETPEECARRETLEETGLQVGHLLYHGLIRFHNYGKDDVDFAVHLFSTKEFRGQLEAGDEGELRWFPVDDLPFAQMWKDDEYWMGMLLKGERFDADFWFDESNKKILKHEIRVKG